MSTQDYLFIADGRELAEIGQWVASAIGSPPVPTTRDRNMIVFEEEGREEIRGVSRGRHAGVLWLVLKRNPFSHLDQPFDELAFADYFPTVIQTFHTGRDRDYQYSETINLFLRLSRTATVPMAVMEQSETLIAVFTPTIGIYWLPPHSLPDPEARDTWELFLPEIEAASADSRPDRSSIDDEPS
jgi:hypothetical protein